MLNHHEGHAGILRQMLEQLLQSFEAASRSTDANHRKSDAIDVPSFIAFIRYDRIRWRLARFNQLLSSPALAAAGGGVFMFTFKHDKNLFASDFFLLINP